MTASAIFCPRCRAPVPQDRFDRPALAPCVVCGAPLGITTFPALAVEEAPGRTDDGVAMDDEATCFYHARKRAAVACDNCGRFLCTLCDIQLGDRHLCPACVASADEQKRLSEMDTRRTLYDSLALTLALTPAIVTPLIALYLAFRHWSTPMGLTPRGPARWIAAVAIALAQIALWVWVFTVAAGLS
ncbi:MAG: hypothetical protein ACE15C_02475 [Phycisphaerae bacterium]